ncbi:MAG: hypothetical protein MUC84_08435 [Solirubrobacteraceae bacterium]|jgi:hypothetical protein|nr:hypothetical protein [Solirubrobacteraceae bacterium]
MTDQPFPPEGDELRPPSEDELRAAYEAELKRLRVEEVVVQTVVSLLNLGARRAGLVPGSEGERDLAQVQLAIDGVRALLPVAEPILGPNGAPLRDALAQLQMAYAQLAGGAGPEGGPEEPGGGGPGGAGPGGPGPGPQGGAGGPAESSGRLWVPGQ